MWVRARGDPRIVFMCSREREGIIPEWRIVTSRPIIRRGANFPVDPVGGGGGGSGGGATAATPRLGMNYDKPR